MKPFRCIAVAALALGSIPSLAKDDTVVVYSSRGEDLIKPVFDAYTAATGTKVQYITDTEAALIQRLKGEGARTKADLFITVDAGNLWQAANEDVLQPVESKILAANVPAHLRDPQNRWYGLSVRARTIIYSTKRVKPADLSSYEDLATDKWKKRLCLRTSKKVYNQSLVAMLIVAHGEAETQKVVQGWVKNLATEVLPSDNDVIKAIDAGQCDVGIVNTYYFGRMKKDKPELNVAIFWPNQNNAGVHVNVSGAGVTKHAPNKAAGVKLLEWLSGAQAQKLFADGNLEYPVATNVQPDASVASWGPFKQNVINVSKAGELQATAIKLMDRVNYR